MTTQGLTFGWFIVFPKPEEHKEHDSDDLSDNTPILRSSASDSTSLYHSVSGTHNGSGPKHRISKTGKHLSRILDVLGNFKLAVEKSTTGIEVLVKHEEEIVVCDACVPYAISQPIPKGKKLKEVVITVVSKDQGWSDYLEDYGTHRNSRTWFELSVTSPSEDRREKWRGEVVKNLLAHGDFKEQTREMSDKELYDKAEGGDVLTVWAHARSPGWVNTVKKVVIRYVIQ